MGLEPAQNGLPTHKLNSAQLPSQGWGWAVKTTKPGGLGRVEGQDVAWG